MPNESTKPPDEPAAGGRQEFHRYRQALTITYIVALGLGGVLLLASVVNGLFFDKPSVTSVKPLEPAEYEVCEEKVRGLLDQLSTTSVKLQKEAFVKKLSGEWEEFARKWQKRWKQVNLECQFDELADTGRGRAYDRMAWVHRNLPPMELKYRELMQQFTTGQASELAEMRRALDKSKQLLEKQNPPSQKTGRP